MAKVIHLNRLFLYFLEVEVEVFFFIDRKPKAEKQRFLVGPFLSPQDRTVWKRAFWHDLALDVRRYCTIKPVTHQFITGRRCKLDIDVREFLGQPDGVARRVVRMAQEKRKKARSS